MTGVRGSDILGQGFRREWRGSGLMRVLTGQGLEFLNSRNSSAKSCMSSIQSLNFNTNSKFEASGFARTAFFTAGGASETAA